METKEKVEGFKFLAEYVGCDQDQINFGGNDDPQKLLNVGEIYKVKDEEMVPENLDSISNLANFIKRKQNGSN